ncbi:hypothetical protein ACFFSY_08060 [Paenibacillus aurantiacus]|uniref:Uncharacterized protein n=1 Tax=Paenibacillus aurantiacus TaxID=1936118 RepID=A0ABV5KKX3_9BACL
MSGLAKSRGADNDQAAALSHSADILLDSNLHSLERLEAGGPMKVTDWSALSVRTRLIVILVAASSLAAIAFALYAAIAIA